MYNVTLILVVFSAVVLIIIVVLLRKNVSLKRKLQLSGQIHADSLAEFERQIQSNLRKIITAAQLEEFDTTQTLSETADGI